MLNFRLHSESVLDLYLVCSFLCSRMKSMNAGCLSTFAEKEVIFYADLLSEPPVKGMLHFLTSAAVSQIGVDGAHRTAGHFGQRWSCISSAGRSLREEKKCRDSIVKNVRHIPSCSNKKPQIIIIWVKIRWYTCAMPVFDKLSSRLVFSQASLAAIADTSPF